VLKPNSLTTDTARPTSDIIFVGNARCYHTMDWYREAKVVCAPREVLFATDLIDSEGYTRLVNEGDEVIPLYNIDWLLLPTQSKFGNIWRNLVKLVCFPLQAIRLRGIVKTRPNSVVHAHTMYYLFLCWAARLTYVGTPMGSEVLLRPNRSNLYKYFSIKSLAAATNLTVDSIKMQDRIIQLCGKTATIIQNGIDVTAISQVACQPSERTRIVSLRAVTPLYRIDTILAARTRSSVTRPLTLIYPFREDDYRTRLCEALEPCDQDLGRISRADMYTLLTSTLLAISIPESDSSPRSVYEAIFCGCCVAVTDDSWIDALPDCMKSRLFVVQLEDDLWLDRAIEYAAVITMTPYEPSEAALRMFDQRRSMELVASTLYS